MKLSGTDIAFVEKFLQKSVEEIQLIANSGSNRNYYRLFMKDGKTYILTENAFTEENNTFFYLNDVFEQHQILVPELLAVNTEKNFYLQADLGDESLLHILQRQGYTQSVYALYEKSLKQLADLQITTKEKIDYSHCYDFQKFDKKVVENDLFYFKDYFLERLQIPYQKATLIEEIHQLSEAVSNLPDWYFLYRDFQARNIMIRENKPYFIDFQGGMKGFLGYDLVSLLYQAKANLPTDWRQNLKDYYFGIFEKQEGLSRESLEESFRLSLILRFFQLLGAYGLRGLVERKPHFLESILLHLEQVPILLDRNYLDDFPYLKNILQVLTSDEVKEKVKNLISN